MWIWKIVCSRAKSYENGPQITLPQINANCVIPYINDLEYHGQGHMASLSNEWIKTIMMYYRTDFELPNASHTSYMNVQICIMSAFMSINIEHLFRQTNPKNAKIEISIK